LVITKQEEGWWEARDKSGKTGLVPSNFLELLPAGAAPPAAAAAAPAAAAAAAAAPSAAAEGAPELVATALYDYDAGADNQLSFKAVRPCPCPAVAQARFLC
jgi:hypothetical protein